VNSIKKPAGPPTSPAALVSFARAPLVAVARTASASLYDHAIRTCRAAGFTPRISQEVDELCTALSFVRAGAAVAVVPESSKALKVPRIRCVETGQPSAVFDIGLP
jgi:LysR family transcriptional regulator, benzoate and cis,cis-muconate-responsive activator of ben and cat genes